PSPRRSSRGWRRQASAVVTMPLVPPLTTTGHAGSRTNATGLSEAAEEPLNVRLPLPSDSRHLGLMIILGDGHRDEAAPTFEADLVDCAVAHPEPHAFGSEKLNGSSEHLFGTPWRLFRYAQH